MDLSLITLICEDSDRAEEALAVAKQLGLSHDDRKAPLRLILDSSGWCLRHVEGLRLKIDFDEVGPDYHRRSLRGKEEPLLKALGFHKGTKRILDLSAGLGQDSVFLAQQGAEVTALERHPVLFFLLNQARQESKRPELAGLVFLQSEARDFVTRPEAQNFDAAYFDPMYPEKKKSALPRQEMRIFRHLVGDDLDAHEVFQELRRGGPRRLVVKRPLKAEPLVEKPVHTIKGTTVRYDVYVRST